MKNLKFITLCTIIFSSQNLIGQTAFSDAGLDVELTIDLTTDSLTALIQLKIPNKEELELELNEVRYTDADAIAQESLKEMNAKAKQASYDHSDNEVQHQTLKYNKMEMLSAKQPVAWAFNYLMYLVLGGIVLFASVLVWVDENKIATT